MRRALDLDVLRCPRCAGRMELLAAIDDLAVIARILAHLGLAGTRDGPEPAAAVSRPRDDRPMLPFVLPSGLAGPPAKAVVCPSRASPMAYGVPRYPTAAV